MQRTPCHVRDSALTLIYIYHKSEMFSGLQELFGDDALLYLNLPPDLLLLLGISNFSLNVWTKTKLVPFNWETTIQFMYLYHCHRENI